MAAFNLTICVRGCVYVFFYIAIHFLKDSFIQITFYVTDSIYYIIEQWIHGMISTDELT